VTTVESVEKSLHSSTNQEKEYKGTTTILGENNVDSVTSASLTAYFSTLSTTVKTINVDGKGRHKNLTENELDFLSHVPHLSREETDQFLCALHWLNIALDAGHIEPSQPNVGRIVGWPSRSFPFRSLWVDFIVWCQKNGIEADVPNSKIFSKLLDTIFIRKGELYEFPDLSVCRAKFTKWRQLYASITTRL